MCTLCPHRRSRNRARSAPEADRPRLYLGAMRVMLLTWAAIIVGGIVFFAIVGISHG
jgi:uncharacterized membrane protein